MPDQFLHGVEIAEIDDGARSIETVKSSVIGLIGTAPDADASVFPLNTPVLIAGSLSTAAKLGDTGTLPDAVDSIFDQTGAMIVVIRVDASDNITTQLTNVIGGVGTDGNYNGVYGFLAAQSKLGAKPKIIIAPGFTHQRPDGGANPVVSELLGILERLRGVCIMDGANTTDADAIQQAQDFGSKRVFLVDPNVTKYGANGTYNAYASAHVAGLIAKSDNERGFWWSPSNQEINGITGTARPIDFTLGDTNCRANYLNENKVATIINENGYRLWGNRTLSSDEKWKYLCVVRTADMINESLQLAHLWAVDRNITKTYVDDVKDGINAYLRHLTTEKAILGGSCWFDKDLNTADQIANGTVYWDFEFTPAYPAEHLVFRSHLTNNYISEIE